MKPAWLIDEYASMRFTSVCTMASTEPTTKVSIASTNIAGRQSSALLGNATTKSRTNATTAATLPSDAMRPVTCVGAP